MLLVGSIAVRDVFVRGVRRLAARALDRTGCATIREGEVPSELDREAVEAERRRREIGQRDRLSKPRRPNRQPL